MSCQTCGSTTDCGCNPCNQVLLEEGLASQITNLINALFGAFTKTVTNGRAVWSALCAPNTDGVACYPKDPAEGFVCYFLRILNEIGTFSASLWSNVNTYCKHTMVASGTSLYVSIQDVPAGIDISNVAYWKLLITAPPGTPGADGAQGPPGASGAGSATNYATQVATVTVLLSNTGAVVFCEPAAGAIVINLPQITAVDPGKWYKIWTNGAFNVTVTPFAGDTINGGGSISLNVANEAVELISNSLSDWRIF